MQLIQTVLNEITGVLEQVDSQKLCEVAQCIQKSCRIFVDGEGRSGLMAKGFAMRLMHLGYQVYVVGETITPAVAKDDVFIAISGSGESAYVVSDTLKAQQKGCTVIAVTSKPQSTAAKAASVVLTVPGTVKGDSEDVRGSVQLLSSLFDQSLHITLDVLCLMLSERDHITNSTATQKHW